MLLGALVAAGRASALEVPDKPAGRISDFAGAMSSIARQSLEDQLRGYAEGQTSQYAVGVFAGLDGESLEDFSIRVAEKWKIGSKKESDGVLLLVFLAEHKVRIEVGYGLEGKLTDAFCAKVIREQIAPAFRAGDIAGGIGNALAAIDEQATGRTHVPPAPHVGRQRGNEPDGKLGGLLLFGIVLVVIIFLARRNGRGGRGGGDGLGGFLLGMTLGSGGWSSGGGGGGGGGGSDFGGGGGGFGGGGASGDW